MEYLHKLEGQE